MSDHNTCGACRWSRRTAIREDGTPRDDIVTSQKGVDGD